MFVVVEAPSAKPKRRSPFGVSAKIATREKFLRAPDGRPPTCGARVEVPARAGKLSGR